MLFSSFEGSETDLFLWFICVLLVALFCSLLCVALGARSNKHSKACLHTQAYGSKVANNPAPCLITGLGRTGTTYVTELLRVLGWSMSHDNGGDYCPCPGKHGAVSYPLAWSNSDRCKIETFAPKIDRLFRNVVHQVREPLAYINSRAVSGNMLPFSGCRLKRPKSKDLRTPKWAHHVQHVLHKYVLQNTFVGVYADWRFRIEDVRDNNAVAVELCQRCGLHDQPRNRSGSPVGCPAQHEIDVASDFLPQDTNHNHSAHANYTWRQLFYIDPDMATAAIILGNVYGYAISPVESLEGLQLRCGFVDNDVDKAWNCRLDRSRSPNPTPKPQLHLVQFVPGVGSLVRRFVGQSGAAMFELYYGPGAATKDNTVVSRAELIAGGHAAAVLQFEQLGLEHIMPKSRLHRPPPTDAEHQNV